MKYSSELFFNPFLSQEIDDTDQANRKNGLRI